MYGTSVVQRKSTPSELPEIRKVGLPYWIPQAKIDPTSSVNNTDFSWPTASYYSVTEENDTETPSSNFQEYGNQFNIKLLDISNKIKLQKRIDRNKLLILYS